MPKKKVRWLKILDTGEIVIVKDIPGMLLGGMSIVKVEVVPVVRKGLFRKLYSLVKKG